MLNNLPEGPLVGPFNQKALEVAFSSVIVKTITADGSFAALFEAVTHKDLQFALEWIDIHTIEVHPAYKSTKHQNIE